MAVTILWDSFHLLHANLLCDSSGSVGEAEADSGLVPPAARRKVPVTSSFAISNILISNLHAISISRITRSPEYTNSQEDIDL